MEEIETVKCECCGLKEECTQHYISQVKANFDAKWLCGLCSEAVHDEIFRSKTPPPPPSTRIQDAVKAHMLFCRKFKSNPAVRVADGMKQILRRRSSDLSSSHSSSPSSSSTSSQVRDMSSFSSSFT
ncbi:uncharacterized protein LOC111778702 [Cucurbita pepo subsp. pepo]|uniref:uncharacterized protein LOC111778702 n=1 Tax=Cucurbita pepo subsp. pepo TaxID=3664 RepID=UPI000C9D81CB|nr:uncharacterized protein LOC111778702 [Cucurbita pepo subsp. pepo]